PARRTGRDVAEAPATAVCPEPRRGVGLDAAEWYRVYHRRLWRRIAPGPCREPRRGAHDDPLDQRHARRDERVTGAYRTDLDLAPRGGGAGGPAALCQCRHQPRPAVG